MSDDSPIDTAGHANTVDSPQWKGGELMTATLLSWIDRMRSAEEGQGLAEYALILALIAVIAIIALIFLGTQISDKLSVIGNAL
jgi:pilus assembly protein Flp/PilA